jgi:hypothetical protein
MIAKAHNNKDDPTAFKQSYSSSHHKDLLELALRKHHSPQGAFSSGGRARAFAG